MSKDCNTYIQSLDYVNNMRTKLNTRQTRLLKLYEELEKQDKNLYSKVMEIIRKYQKRILDFTGEKMSYTEGIIKSINIDRDIRELVESLRSREKPEGKIPYVHYPTEVDFDKCEEKIKNNYQIKDEIANNSFNDACILNTSNRKSLANNIFNKINYSIFIFNFRFKFFSFFSCY